MPLVFSYGTLQHEDVQLATVGRKLAGQADELAGFELSQVPITDPAVVAALGRAHHPNVVRRANDACRVAGMVFEVTDAELAQFDEYEAAYSYKRIGVTLASGWQAWLYVDAASHVST